MSPTEAAALLVVAAAYDGRKPDEDVAKAWAFALDGLAFAECRDAIVAHYRANTDWIKPAHVRETVKRTRAKRIAEFGPILPPANLADDPAAEAAWITEAKRRIGAGEITSSEQLPNQRGELMPRTNLRRAIAASTKGANE